MISHKSETKYPRLVEEGRFESAPLNTEQRTRYPAINQYLRTVLEKAPIQDELDVIISEILRVFEPPQLVRIANSLGEMTASPQEVAERCWFILMGQEINMADEFRSVHRNSSLMDFH